MEGEISASDIEIVVSDVAQPGTVSLVSSGYFHPEVLMQMTVSMGGFNAALQAVHDSFTDLIARIGEPDMSSTPDGDLYDYQGRLEELLAAKRRELDPFWPNTPGWRDPLGDIVAFKREAEERARRQPPHPVHKAPQEHWKRYLAAGLTGQDIQRDFEIPCWLDEAFAFMTPQVPPPVRGGTFFYCPWQERRMENGRLTYWSCGPGGHVGWATGTRHRSARAYRHHYRKCHLS